VSIIFLGEISVLEGLFFIFLFAAIQPGSSGLLAATTSRWKAWECLL
jgi:hypothetical protein